MEFFTFNSPEERAAKMQEIANRNAARVSFDPDQPDSIEFGPDRPRSSEMSSVEQLQFLVQSCDYRGVQLTVGEGCCGDTWHCAMGKGYDRDRPFAVTFQRCIRCVDEGLYDPVTGGEPRIETPGLLKRAANVARAAITHVAAGLPTMPPGVKEARLAICQTNTCGYYKNSWCMACGCYLPTKTALPAEFCPLNPPLWGPVTE